MRNWKTTLTAVIGAGAALAGGFGFHVPAEVQVAIVTVTVFFVGLFSADAQSDAE
jgi:fatty acid desaturase